MSSEKGNFAEPPPPYGMPSAPMHTEHHLQMPMPYSSGPQQISVHALPMQPPQQGLYPSPYPMNSSPNQPMNPPPNQQTVVVNVRNFGPYPQHVTCPSCQANVLTTVDTEAGLLSWILCGGLCLVGCWLGCCLIPCCISSCKDAIHRCPNCHTIVGSYKRL